MESSKLNGEEILDEISEGAITNDYFRKTLSYSIKANLILKFHRFIKRGIIRNAAASLMIAAGLILLEVDLSFMTLFSRVFLATMLLSVLTIVISTYALHDSKLYEIADIIIRYDYIELIGKKDDSHRMFKWNKVEEVKITDDAFLFMIEGFPLKGFSLNRQKLESYEDELLKSIVDYNSELVLSYAIEESE